jgi:hypothetical protein
MTTPGETLLDIPWAHVRAAGTQNERCVKCGEAAVLEFLAEGSRSFACLADAGFAAYGAAIVAVSGRARIV